MQSDNAVLEAPARISFVGLGNMGLPMARNLIRAGYTVTGTDLSADARNAFSAMGGKVAASPEEQALDADILITMLPTGKIVRDILLQDPGLSTFLTKGSIVIDMSSSSPIDTKQLQGELENRGLALVDAPVSGGVAKAEDGTLAIMVGGDTNLVERIRPVLDAMGGSIIHTGETGTAHAMKALNNFVSAAGLVAVSEALNVGQRFGLAPKVIVEALNASTGRNNTSEKKALQFMVPENYVSGFAMALMAKDIGIAASMADELGMDMNCLKTMNRLWQDASAELGSTADHTAMHQFIGKGRPQ